MRTLADRKPRCLLAWAVEVTRSEVVRQHLVDPARQARFHYRDLFALSRPLIYHPGLSTPSPDKSEPFRDKSLNAE